MKVGNLVVAREPEKIHTGIITKITNGQGWMHDVKSVYIKWADTAPRHYVAHWGTLEENIIYNKNWMVVENEDR